MDRFRRCFSRCSPREQRVRAAGRTVLLRVAGDELEAGLLEALGPPVEEGAAELTIEVWDEESTGVAGPEVEPGLRLAAEARFYTHRTHTGAVAGDRRERRLVGFFSSSRQRSFYEWGRPFHLPLCLWCRDLGIPVVHAAMVAEGGKGALLAGPAGSGKSTVTRACLGAGLQFLGDDQVALWGGRGASLFASLFLEGEQTEFGARSVPGEKKSLALLVERRVHEAEVRAVVLPRVTGGPARLSRLAPARALLGLAPSSLAIPHAGSGRIGFEAMSGLVERVPCFQLELGEAERLPDLIREALG